MHWLPVNLDAVRQEGTVFSITACAVNSPRALRATTTISRRANGHGCGVYLCVSRIASLNVMARVSVLSSVAGVSVLSSVARVLNFMARVLNFMARVLNFMVRVLNFMVRVLNFMARIF
jgi:hypothetical protein